MGGSRNNTVNPGYWQQPAGPGKNYWATTTLGGTSILFLSLDWFYFENQRWRNRWSNSNVGYDLARYFGTDIYLPPHDDLWYIVTYDTEFTEGAKKSYAYAHPAIQLLTRPHKLVKPRKYGGKGKHIRLRPPSVFDTQWYRTTGWCGAALAKLSFSLFNPYLGGLHKQQTVWPILIGAKTDRPYNTYVIGSAFKPDTYYRWDWDTGEGNELLLPYARTPIGNEVEWTHLKWDAPYWMWFWGKTYDDFLGNLVGQNDATAWGNVKLKWYPIADTADKGPHTDPQKKVWINLCYTGSSNTATVNGPATCLRIANFGPYAMAVPDLSDANAQFSIPFFYRSKWQWGGSIQGATTNITDPCSSLKPKGVHTADPAQLPATVLHPWDLERNGHINSQKFQQLITGLGYRQPKQEDPNPLYPPGQEPEPTPELDYYSSEGGEDSEAELLDWPEDSDDSEEETGTRSHHSSYPERLRKLAERLRHEREQRRELGRGVLALLKPRP